MPSLSISHALTLLVLVPSCPMTAAVSTNLSSVCEYNCENCSVSDPWYVSDPSSSQCTNRTSKTPRFFAVSFRCRRDEMVIRDEQSCRQIVDIEHPVHPQTPHKQFIMGTVYTTFNKSRGCRIHSKHSSLFGLDRVQTQICFGIYYPLYALGIEIGAIVIGVLLGLVSTCCSRKHAAHFVDRLVDVHGEGVLFRPGARVVAMHSLVPSYHRHALIFYRFNQVIANVWLPMALMWIVSPLIVLPLFILFYWVPPLLVVGLAFLSQPRHAITPASCSLHGIAVNQRSATGEFAFSMLRPILFCGAVTLAGYVIVSIGRATGLNDDDIGAWVTNPVGFWRAGLESQQGNIVLYVSAGVTIVGTILHTCLTILPVSKSCLGIADEEKIICFDTNEEKRAEIEDLTQLVCDAAVKDEYDDEDRVAALEVETLSLFNVIVALSLAIIDFLAYVYKIYAFLKDARYPLAAMMTVALVEAFTTLVGHGHIRAAPQAFHTTVVSGVPTVHFIALTQWDDGLCGIPSLFLTVYGLPLTRIESWWTCASSIFFLITGTRALAAYLCDVTDGDMYGVPKGWVHEGVEGQTDEEEDSEEEGVALNLES